MWFWSVFWSTNCPVCFSIFLVKQKKICPVSDIFVHSLEFFVQSFSKNEKLTGRLVGPETDQNHIFKKDWTKNSREWTKKIWYWTNFSLVDQKKWEIDRTIGRPRDWPKPHGRDFYQLTQSLTALLPQNTTDYRRVVNMNKENQLIQV